RWRVFRSKEEPSESGNEGWHEHRDGDSHAGNRPSEKTDDGRDKSHTEQAAHEESGGKQEIQRDQSRDDCSPDIDGDHRLLVMLDERDNVAHTEEVHSLL